MNPSPSASFVQALHWCQWELGQRKPEGISLLLENGEEGAYYESGVIIMLPIKTFLVLAFQA